MYIHRLGHVIRNPGKFIRLFTNKRCSWILWIILFSFCLILLIKHHQSESKTTRLQSSKEFPLTFNEVKVLLDQLFDPFISLNDLQLIWNKLITLWHRILIKFLHDACQLCHENHSDCYESIDLTRYIYYINESFYPLNENKRPNGMGIYYYIDLKSFHSLNNSILPTDVSFCDYFHMIQLMMNVQLILHQAQIKYFLTKGTLIGTLRHHDIIPWDTDIDLFIPFSATNQILRLFQQFDLSLHNITKSPKDRRSYREDLVLYQFRNIYRVISYKIFSLRSPIINGTNYRWPKIDIFPYRENSTHIYAYPKHQHNLGTMNSIAKNYIQPIYLRLLGPILVPSPNHPRKSLKAMVKLGRSNVFYVCEGNTFLHRSNRQSTETWRVPCEELRQSYSFVRSERNSTNGLCYEQLISSQQNQSLSFYVYKCDEHLQRTFTKN